MTWALRHSALSALVLGVAVALGVAAAAPGLTLVPHLEPIRDVAWGTGWSSLAADANVARDRALAALSGATAAAATAVLVVTALTVLSLSIARAAQRRSEIVVRRAVGASRGALRRAALLEGGVIALAGLGAGTAAAVAAAAVMRGAWPGVMGVLTPGPVFWILGLGAVVVLGALLPLGFARPRLPGSDATGRGVPLFVPATQFALGLLGILAGAQLTRRVAPQPSLEPGKSGTIVPLSFADSTRNVPALLDSVLERLRADSTVTVASLSSPGTLIGLGQVDVITTDCGRCYQGGIATPLRVVQATSHLASADTFSAMELPLGDGRLLSDADRWGAPPVAVINRYLAEREFEGGRAVGRQVRVGGPDSWYWVVGIVEDGRFDALGAGATPRPRVFLSALQHEARELDLLLRTADGRAHRAAAAAAGVPLAAIGEAASERELFQREAAAARWFARILSYEGWGALLVAALGMLAVMRLWVTGVLPELALRRAVGARTRHVLGRVAAGALLVAGGGAAIAWWLEPLGSAALARAVSRLPQADAALLGVPLVALLLATLAAIAGPAWRAARAAPATLPGFSDL